MPALLVIAPRLNAPGGIASVVRTLLDGGLRERYDLRLVETVGPGSVPARAFASATGVLRGLRAVHGLPNGSVVHLHLSQGGSFTRKAMLARFARARGHRVVLHIHGSRFHAFAAAPGNAPRVRLALEAADRVIVLSATWLERIRALAPAARIVVMENPVVVPSLARCAAHADGILFLGRLGERKGVPTLLEAVRLLQESGVRTRVTIAGDGEVTETRRIAASLPHPADVSVPGWVDGAVVERELLPSHGIYCLPSRDEGQPIALLQAMAAGMACVVTPVGGVPDTVTDAVDAAVVPVDDAGALADVLRWLLDDEAARQRLGAAARRTAVARFDVRVCVERLVALYGEVGLRDGRPNG